VETLGWADESPLRRLRQLFPPFAKGADLRHSPVRRQPPLGRRRGHFLRRGSVLRQPPLGRRNGHFLRRGSVRRQPPLGRRRGHFLRRGPLRRQPPPGRRNGHFLRRGPSIVSLPCQREGDRRRRWRDSPPTPTKPQNAPPGGDAELSGWANPPFAGFASSSPLWQGGLAYVAAPSVVSLPCQREGDRRQAVEGFLPQLRLSRRTPPRRRRRAGRADESPRHFVALPPFARGACLRRGPVRRKPPPGAEWPFSKTRPRPSPASLAKGRGTAAGGGGILPPQLRHGSNGKKEAGHMASLFGFRHSENLLFAYCSSCRTP
jgi:hypothetical protein